ncbi:MAG: EamA family transporter [Patescibacteria group bacterium]|jgi:drug/metabolite transporter (DMT)-like permease
MNGLILAVIAAVLYGILEAEKKRATDYFDVKIIFWGLVTLAAPVFGVLLFAQGIPHIDHRFWLVIAIDTPLLIFSSILFIKAEKISPISTTLPLLSFTPVFLIPTSFFILGELPKPIGIVGIFLVVLGAIALKGEDLRKRFRHPVSSILKDPGAKYILLVALIWSFNANFSKLAIGFSSVWFYLFVSHFLEALFMNVWLSVSYRQELKSVIRGHVSVLVRASVTNMLAVFFFMAAIQQTLVSYVITLKRVGFMLGGLILGALVFKEKHIAYRIGGAALMLVGVFCIIFFY